MFSLVVVCLEKLLSQSQASGVCGSRLALGRSAWVPLDAKLGAEHSGSDWGIVTQSILKGLPLFLCQPGAPEVGTGLLETPLKPAFPELGRGSSWPVPSPTEQQEVKMQG